MFGADQFADADTLACGHVRRAANYPGDFPGIAEQLPDAPWIFTGALENHPHLVAQITGSRPLYGNPDNVLQSVRCPSCLADALREGNFLYPETRPINADQSTTGIWLSKPVHSAGGLGIHTWNGSSKKGRQNMSASDFAHTDIHTCGIESPTTFKELSGTRILQRHVAGTPLGAVYMAARGNAVLLGLTQSVQKDPECLTKSYAYRGSVGPIPTSNSLRKQFQDLGKFLAERFGLVGLFGVDAIVQEDQAWVLEVNPRYPSSAELLERAFHINMVNLHVAACRDGRLPDAPRETPKSIWGKRICYATSDLQISDRFSSHLQSFPQTHGWPPVADIPTEGTFIRRGSPLLTVFSDGPDAASVEDRLRARIQEVHAWLVADSTI